MIVVLDTNAFYQFMGEKILKKPVTNNKVKLDGFDELIYDPNHEIALSSVTIYEFLVHFRKDIPVIKDGLFFIKNNIKKIYNDPSLPFTVRDIDLLLALSDYNFSKKINSYMQEKIDMEASLSTFFFSLFIAQWTNNYLTAYPDLQTDQVLNTYPGFVVRHCMAQKNIFVLTLQYGYETNDAETVVKNQFNEIIYHFLLQFIELLESIKNNPNNQITENKFAKNTSKDQILKQIQRNKIEKNNLNEWISNFHKKTNLDFDDFAKVSYKILENKGLDPKRIEYMEWILTKMGKQGKKFLKNDISDMLIAVVLKDSDIPLITFDEGMQDFIVKINHISKSYIEKVYTR